MPTFARCFLTLCVLLLPAAAGALEPGERRQLLDAARPVAAKMAGQPVRIKVDILNKDGDWAVLVGSLVGQPGKEIDWNLSDCHADLDKMLWVVMRRSGAVWKVRHIEICASEPPYWYMEQYRGEVWPCGVFAGLDNGHGDMAQSCRRERAPEARKRQR